MKAIFLDIETSGLNPQKHVPLEIAMIIRDLSGKEKDAVFTTFVKMSENDLKNASQEAFEVNGINLLKSYFDEGKTKEQASEDIIKFLLDNLITKSSAVFICQNPAFDKAFFLQLVDADQMEKYNFPYHWLDLASMFWIKFIAPKKRNKFQNLGCSLSKDSIALYLNFQKESVPHRALNGVKSLISCYDRVVSRI